YVMRSIPAAAGVLALPLFAAAARLLIGPRAAPIAVAVLALCCPMAEYATIFKQYSCDVMVSAGLLLLVARQRTIALVAGGVIAMWLSDPAPILMTGPGLLLLLELVQPRSATDRSAAAASVAVWLASAGVLYLVHTR